MKALLCVSKTSLNRSLSSFDLPFFQDHICGTSQNLSEMTFSLLYRGFLTHHMPAGISVQLMVVSV
jgi:hypothetical protein